MSTSPAPQAPPSNGTVAWALGFLAYIPIPFFNVPIAGLTQAIVGMRLRRHGGLAAENGHRAANWGLTQLAWFALALLCALPIPMMSLLQGGEPIQPPDPLVWLLIAMGVLYLVIGVMQAVYAIAGTVMAARGKVVTLPAIPFLRAPR